MLMVGFCRKYGASTVRSQPAEQRAETEREAGERPARSRHCIRTAPSAQGRGRSGSQIPAVEEEQTLSAERANSALLSWGATRFDP